MNRSCSAKPGSYHSPHTLEHTRKKKKKDTSHNDMLHIRPSIHATHIVPVWRRLKVQVVVVCGCQCRELLSVDDNLQGRQLIYCLR